MRIVDLLRKESILLGAAPESKTEAIDMLADLQDKGGRSPIRKPIRKGFWQERP